MSTPRNSIWALATASCLLSAPGRAEEPRADTGNTTTSTQLAATVDEVKARADARAHFQAGLTKVRNGDLEGAVGDFEQAYRTSPNYAVLYNLAQAYATLGRAVEAVHTFEHFLEEGGDRIDPARRVEVAALIERARAQLCRIELDVSPPGAEVFLDGKRLGVAPIEPQEIPAGEHVVAARAGRVSRVQTMLLSPGEIGRMTLSLEPEPAAEAAPVTLGLPQARPPTETTVARSLPPAPSRNAALDRHHKRSWALGLGIGGAALALASVSIYTWNTGRYEDWRLSQKAFNASLAHPSPDAGSRSGALAHDAASIQRADDLALGLALGASIALVGAGVLWLTSGSEPATSTARAPERRPEPE